MLITLLLLFGSSFNLCVEIPYQNTNDLLMPFCFAEIEPTCHVCVVGYFPFSLDIDSRNLVVRQDDLFRLTGLKHVDRFCFPGGINAPQIYLVDRR